MKLSIITVNLNNRDGLQKTIDSVVSQTFKDFEWIVIDGGSTDGSKELLEQYADHFAYWVSEPDKGIYNAMNKGIRIAKGEYLMFLNSGDTYYKCTTLSDLIKTGLDADIVFGNYILQEEKTNNEKEPISFPDILPMHQLVCHSIGHASSAIKSELLKEELYDETLRIVSDWKFFLRKALEGKSFQHVDIIICVFDGTGISSTNESLLQEERQKVLIKEIPPCIIADSEIINDLTEKLLPFLYNWQTRDVLHYSSKKKIYHKIISAALSLIKFLDRKKIHNGSR